MAAGLVEKLEAAEGADRCESGITASQAEFAGLKARVEPNFLEGLNSIGTLVSADARRAREMYGTLADFLRSSLTLGAKPGVRVEEQPTDGGVARLEARRTGHRLRIIVEIPLDSDSPKSVAGLDSKIVRERLAAAYGDDAIFAAKRLSDRYLAVISIPVRLPRQRRKVGDGRDDLFGTPDES